MSMYVGSKLVSLVSDFGLEDPFVGIMKGVMAAKDPDIRFVDLTHLVKSQDILHGCLALKSAYHYFPKGTVHLAVVDPGVGSDRKGLAIESEGHYFVGPDNGIFSFLFNEDKSFNAVELTNSDYFRSPISSTFHGRDIFAPVAAYLSSGGAMRELGSPLAQPVRLNFPSPVSAKESVSGEVIYIDTFGNLTTNITESDLKKVVKPGLDEVVFSLKGLQGKIVDTYSRVGKGKLAGVINSWDMLEIFVNQGSAMGVLRAEKGCAVTVAPSSE